MLIYSRLHTIILNVKFKVEKLPAAQAETSVFVKDSEGYVFKKPAEEVSDGERIISEKEYMRVSGLSSYKKKSANSKVSRKRAFGLPLKFRIQVTKEEKDFIDYAREHHLNYADLMQM